MNRSLARVVRTILNFEGAEESLIWKSVLSPCTVSINSIRSYQPSPPNVNQLDVGGKYLLILGYPYSSQLHFQKVS